MYWDWDYAWSIVPTLLEGLKVTLQATIAAAALAFVFGLVLAIARQSHRKVLARPVWAFIEVVRSTPLLIQLYFVFYILPDLGIKLSPLVCGITALGVYYSSYAAEAYRAGIEGVPRGQWEAATVVNLPALHTWTRVVLPQALRTATPFLGNYIIAMFKDSALLSTVTVIELMGAARSTAGVSYRWFEAITLVGAMYFLVSYIASILVRRAEVRLAHQ